MIYLLKASLYDEAVNADPASIHSKHYQYIEMKRMAELHDFCGAITADIGSKTNFSNLSYFRLSRARITIDPYNGAPGGGLTEMPKLPYPFALFRCAVGEDSEIIPSRMFDITFSISVIEHIGQKEANYDCVPTESPPIAQETKRNRFSVELLRITKPGGVTIHTVDHAARNLSFVRNFLNAGWQLLNDECIPPSVDECLYDADAVRQRVHWTKHDEELEDQELHAVLMMGFRRPNYNA